MSTHLCWSVFINKIYFLIINTLFWSKRGNVLCITQREDLILRSSGEEYLDSDSDLKIYKLYRNAFVLVFIFDMIFNPKCTIKYQVSKLDATLHSPYDEQ